MTCERKNIAKLTPLAFNATPGVQMNLHRHSNVLALQLLFLFWSTAVPASVQAREFYKITCDKESQRYSFEPVYESVSDDQLWPRSDISRWDAHVRSMKKLEKEKGLYVLRESYGYYDPAPITCDLGKLKVLIRSAEDIVEIPELGEKRSIRGVADLVVISSDGKELVDFTLFGGLLINSVFLEETKITACMSSHWGPNYSACRTIDVFSGERMITKEFYGEFYQ